MQCNMSFRLATRFLVTSLAIAMIVLIVDESKRWFPVDDILYQSTSPQAITSCMKSTSALHQMKDICSCPRAAKHSLLLSTLRRKPEVASACDDEATARGFNQSVVSYTFYGNISSDYFRGIRHNALKVARMYPGYLMRVYHDLDVAGDEVASKALCKLWCDHDHLDFCDVRHLPEGLCNQRHIFGMVWRFFVLGDPLVSRFLIRDIDSDIIEREVDSVREWVASRKTWHVMRDHPFHATTILGGMWGGTNDNLTMTTELRKTFIENGNSLTNRGHDQSILNKFLWPRIVGDMVAHDSYLCGWYFGSSPWPTRRQRMDFVGDKFPWKEKREFELDKECPVECRPKNHRDWTYC